MKNLGTSLLILAIVVVVAGFSQFGYFTKTVCERTLLYSIKNDSRFDISNEDLLMVIYEAEQLWEEEIGIDFFMYDPEADFSINLVYDNRQQQTDAAKDLISNLDSNESKRDVLERQLNRLNTKKITLGNLYANDLSLYTKKLNKYNDEVNSWNKKGGAPRAIFSRLQNTAQELSKDFENLEEARLALNEITNEINALIAKSNGLVSIFNQGVSTYQERFGSSREFDQGDYTGSAINIYQFSAFTDLRLVLAHEFGHALDVSHVSDSAAIMHFLLGDQDIDNPSLANDDILAIAAICNS